MKHLALILCSAGLLALAGCGGDGDDLDGRGGGGPGGGGGAVSNLQAFVLNNCNDVQPFAAPVPIAAGASFPQPQVTDPANSVYTMQCVP